MRLLEFQSYSDEIGYCDLFQDNWFGLKFNYMINLYLGSCIKTLLRVNLKSEKSQLFTD